MNQVMGLHHVAISTADIKTQIDFFTDKLGMELVALYWMHGVKNTWHGFLRLNDESSVAFVENPKIAEIPVTLGQTHAGNPTAPCARGAMQHLALKVADEDALLAMRDRLRSKNVPVLGPVDHGFCTSIYFAGPENLSLELSYSVEPIDAQAWIDPEVAGLAGISAEELARYRQPEAFMRPDSAVPQPAADGPGPHMSNYPEGLYRKLVEMSDADMRAGSETDPPVKVTRS